jgi:hypothetical protein
MTKKSMLLGLLLFIFGFQGFFIFSIPISKANITIPSNFYFNLDTNSTYVYNVTEFGGDLNWLGFDYISKYNTSTNIGGQITVKFTGFYEKNPDDMYNAFQSPMPYMNIEFKENKAGVLTSNHTFYNVSNGEIASNTALGYNYFKSGLLIPINNMTYLKELALAQDSGFMSGKITVEESSNFISFDFKQNSKFQNTTLVYEKKTGLLIWARTKLAPITNPLGYNLEMFLTNYSLDLTNTYSYNVTNFNEAAIFWYDWNNYFDTWTTNEGGIVNVSFTGFYPKDPYEPEWATDAFPNNVPRAWLNIEIFYKGFSGQIGPQINLNNISNREAAIQMTIGYGAMQPGFLIPLIDNLTFIKEKALATANPGEVEIIENELTVQINYNQIGGSQQITSLIYEKMSGLLQWVYTSVGDYTLEMNLIGFTLPKKSTPTTPHYNIPSYGFYVLGLVILISPLIIFRNIKSKIK